MRIRTWYTARTVREQWLLAAMATLAVPVLAWLLIVRPVSNAYEHALRENLEAVDRHGRILFMTQAAKAQPARRGVPQDIELQLVVTEAAGLAGLTLAEATPSGRDQVTVSVVNASAASAGEWIRSLEARGLVVNELRMSPAAEGGVSVSASLARR